MYFWLSILSLVTFVGSLLILPWLVCLIPEDYFCHRHRSKMLRKDRHPALVVLLTISKNLLGWFLLAGGILMLFLPGQGLLTMAMGLLLMDYPGKYHLEQKVVSRPLILKGLNWMRRRRGEKPLQVPSTRDGQKQQ